MDGLATPALDAARPHLTASAAGCPAGPARQAAGGDVTPGGPSAWAELAGTPFVKMSGGGNDFLVFDDRGGSFPRGRPALVAALCARGTGVGADAVLLLESPVGEADFRMGYFNADGSEAPMCGNGALCIARYAAASGLGRDGVVRFETGAGVHRAELSASRPSRVRLALRDPSGIAPALADIEARGYARAGFADTGTPHLVVLVPDVDAVDAAGEGAALRRHPLFVPAGLNVNFAQVVGPGELRLRTYERGVEAETLSCGTGSTAAALLTHLWGLTRPPVVVRPRGGIELRVDFRREAGGFRDVTLEGDARIVYEGRLSPG